MKDLANFTDKESQVTVGDGIMAGKGDLLRSWQRFHYAGFGLEYEVHGDDQCRE